MKEWVDQLMDPFAHSWAEADDGVFVAVVVEVVVGLRQLVAVEVGTLSVV